MLPSHPPVGVAFPDLEQRRLARVPEDDATIEVGAAERDTAVPQDREREPRAIAGVADGALPVERARPVVEVRDVDLVGDGPPVIDERLLLGPVALAHERQDQLGTGPAELRPHPHEPFDVGDDLVVLEAHARPLEHVAPGRVHADVDGVQAGCDHVVCDLFVDEGPVADYADLSDARLLRVGDLASQAAVHERLAVVVQPDVPDPKGGTLIDHPAVEALVHHALPSVHLVARAEHAARVADVRAFDLDDLGQPRGAVAPGAQEDPPDQSGPRQEEFLDAASDGCPDAQRPRALRYFP